MKYLSYASGGAFLGSLIYDMPGAIIGIVFALAFAFYYQRGR